MYGQYILGRTHLQESMMGKEFKTYTCKYKADWPVVEYGRLGGMYSLADMPVQGYVELE